MSNATREDEEEPKGIAFQRLSEDDGENNNNDNQNSNNGVVVIDDPCWGSPTECSLVHLLRHFMQNQVDNNNNNNNNSSTPSKRACLLYESPHFVAIDKPADLRMDGEYPATVHKLLTYWFPPPSVVAAYQKALASTPEAATLSSSTTTNNIDNNKHDTAGEDLDFAAFVQSFYHMHSDHEDNECRPCHQLDYATSGVLLVARSSWAANVARIALEERRVQKAYLAVVQGKVEVPDPPQQQEQQQAALEQQSPSLPRLSLTTLSKTWASMEDQHRKRQKRPKRKVGTFHGYQPASNVYQQWQSQQRKKKPMPQGEEEEEEGQEASAEDANTTKTNDNNKKQQQHPKYGTLSEEQWERVWEPLHNPPSDVIENQKKDRGGPFIVKPDMTWKQVKNTGQSIRFQQAAVVYNQILKRRLDEQAGVMPSLPIGAFGLDDSADENVDEAEDNDKTQPNDDHNKSSSSSNDKDTFFICASIAEVKGRFAVTLNPKETESLLQPTSHLLAGAMETAGAAAAAKAENITETTTIAAATEQTNGSSTTTSSSSSSSLLFRPALTQCTILEYDPTNDTTKVLLQPWSGRRHQLRIHMALAGHAIVGDPTYNRRFQRQQQQKRRTRRTAEQRQEESSEQQQQEQSEESDDVQHHRRRQRGDRMCLHAYKLSVPLPEQVFTDPANEPQKEEDQEDRSDGIRNGEAIAAENNTKDDDDDKKQKRRKRKREKTGPTKVLELRASDPFV